ncbi:MAG: hypothetical protein ACC657_04725 [Thiohalomonadales bacterium]
MVFITYPTLSIGANDIDNFELGKKAFNNKHYTQALEYFELSKNNGITSISLTYNLAVTYYKLENYEQSRIHFNEIREIPKMTLLVEYNLGLIELKLNNNKKAIELFSKVYKNTEKNKLKSLSKKQLDNLNHHVAGKKPQRIKSRVAILAGHTDNVSNISTGIASGKADNFNVIAANVRGALTKSFDQGLTARLRYYDQSYSVEKQFDFKEIGFKIAYNFITGSYKNNIGLIIKESDYGNNPYQTITGIDAKFRSKMKNNNILMFRLRYEDIKDDSQRYTYLTGTRQRYRVDYQLRKNKQVNRFWYQFEMNDRNDLSFVSYSPTRNTFRYSYKIKFYKHWKFRAGIEYRKSVYPDKPKIKREDDRIRYLGTLGYKFSKMWDIQGVYEYRDNQSSFSKYTYKRNVYFVNLNWRY